MNAYPDISYVASLIGDSTRATILNILLDGRRLPASELAYMAQVSPQTMSSHLAKLVEGQLLAVEVHGRHRYYRLANAEVAHALEALSTLAPPVTVRSLRQSDKMNKVRRARTCYDHLAGRLGVAFTEALLERGYLLSMETEYRITAKGEVWFSALGIHLPSLGKGRRHLAKPCLDWSERRPHLAGALGAAIAKRLFELEWIERVDDSRAVRLTEQGSEALRHNLGLIDCEPET